MEAAATNFDMVNADFTITARIKTTTDGTIVGMTKPEGAWAPNGKVFFVGGGKLAYDIGWVGQIRSATSVNDGKWHDVALRWTEQTGLAEFFIDGKGAGNGTLRPKGGLGGRGAARGV